MLSIVKMDVDRDSESMDDEIHIKEEINLKDELFCIEDSDEALAQSGLDRVPLVYTTRLDDMIILNSITTELHPSEVTGEILKESKPKLRKYPYDNYSLSNKRTFNAVKKTLKKIYHENKDKLEKSDITLGFPNLLIDPDSIKSEVQEDAIGVTEGEGPASPLIKCEVFDEPILRECKYSELLKLCRPCSVVLPKLYGYEVNEQHSVQTDEPVKPVISKAIIKTVERNQHPNVQVSISSSSDEEPLITFKPNLKSQLESHHPEPTHELDTKTGGVGVCKPFNCLILDENYQKTLIASFNNRVFSDGVLKVSELYSEGYSIYCTDHKGFLLEYYKAKDDSAHNKYVSVNGINYVPVETCCWVHRDRIIQTLYPKVLLYSSARFLRKPHTCPPGACSCCCRTSKGIYDKPDIFPDDTFSMASPSVSDGYIERQALETEMQSSITKMKKELRVKHRNILHNLSKNTKSVIGKALMYQKPLPKKEINNRCLDSLKLDDSQSGVIVLRNFAADEREIYELSPDGELKSYLKLTCFKNTDPPDVKKLLQKAKKVCYVCCWFSREKLITELTDSKTLHPTAVKFIRIRHTCTADECGCCCKPTEVKDVTLTDITFPSRPNYWPELVNKIVNSSPKPPDWLDNYRTKPATSEIVLSPLPFVTKPPRIAPKPTQPTNNKPFAIKFDALVTQAPPLDKQPIRPAFSAGNTNTAMMNDDCQIVGVTTAPTAVGIAPPPMNAVQIEQPNDITNVQDGQVSEEVNGLITSILDRFKDVRLTINSDGKVAAALNTPVSNLTTVELKVLANILSYAQSQVNSLGINSGMSLSNIIHLKVNDQQKAAINVDPASVYKAFGDNVNNNNQSQAAHVNKPFNAATANVIPMPNNFLNLSNAIITNDMPQYFTKSLYEKKSEYTNSFTSLLSTKLGVEPSNSSIPIIQNVFSLKDQVSKTENETSYTTVFCRTPANQNQTPHGSTANINTQKDFQNTNKRTQANTEITAPETKKIRILPPSKLNEVNQPLPITTTQPCVLEVNGIRSQAQPGVRFLSNNNFRIMSVMPQVTKPRIIRVNNFRAFSNLSLTQPSIVVAPLQPSSGNVGQILQPIGTPFSAASVGTSTQTEEIGIREVPFKIEQDLNEEDDCILGV